MLSNIFEKKCCWYCMFILLLCAITAIFIIYLLQSNSKTDPLGSLSEKPLTYKTIEFANFNIRIQNAFESEEKWPKDPALIANEFTDGPFGKHTILSVNKVDTGYDIVIIYDKITDDSVRGYRFDINIEENGTGLLQLTDARKSWSCWEDRGHQDYSNEPCL